MFLKNKYTTWYYSIIERAISQEIKKLSKDDPSYVYYESHHNLPKSLFPEFKKEKWNIVLLTASEHFRCHQLLIEMTQGKHKSKMVCALWNMNHRTNKNMGRTKLDADEYNHARNQFSIVISEFNKKPCLEQTKKKISEKNKGKPNGKKVKNLSKDTIELIRKNRHNATKINTPEGIFDSLSSYLRVNNRFSGTGLRLLIENCDKPITPQRVVSSRYFTINDIGKTPRSLGFYPIDESR
jgi:hypothetical protein